MSKTVGASDKTEKVALTCEVCGTVFWANPNRGAKYCSRKCLDNKRKKIASEQVKELASEGLAIEYPNMTASYYAKHKDKIAHQRDTTVWTSDYAERQKAQTLALTQGIVLYAGDTYTSGVNDEIN